MNKNDLIIAYKVISEIMEKNRLSKDNSFLRVKNYISNAYCDLIKDGETI